MSWRPHGHVRVNSRLPAAAGRCDRCSMLYNWKDLRYQWQWSGEKLINLRLLVCDECLDIPQPQLRARILTPDPVPIINARPDFFAPSGVGPYETDYLYTQDEVYQIAAENGVLLIRENEPTAGPT